MATRTNLPVSPDYDEDGYGWAMAQAALIRARRFDELDLENIAEEIESVGKSEYRAAVSALEKVILHMLKWDVQPSFRSRSWADSIRVHLEHFEREIGDNPSLKPRLDEIRARAHGSARVAAVRETGLALEEFPEAPYAWEAIYAAPADKRA